MTIKLGYRFFLSTDSLTVFNVCNALLMDGCPTTIYVLPTSVAASGSLVLRQVKKQFRKNAWNL